MSQGEMSYARKASGLVRGLSGTDASIGAVLNNVFPVMIWLAPVIGLGVYLGGNLIVATVLFMVVAVVGLPLVWGILGGSMPRSGGEYVYMSRVLHPLPALVGSFAMVFAWLLFQIVYLPWIADPGVTTVGHMMGWESWANFASGKTGMFVIGTVGNILAACCAAFGLKLFARIQKGVMAWVLLGTLVLAVLLTITSRQSFVVDWNTLAARYHSLDFNGLIGAAGAAIGHAVPTTWNWPDTIGLMYIISGSFLYGFFVNYVGGEVKRPEKAVMRANLISIVFTGGILLWVWIALYRLVGTAFLSAASYTAMSGSGGYKLPWTPTPFGFVAVITSNKVVLFLVSTSLLLIIWWAVALVYMIVPRPLFAWSMDRLGPKWFTSLNRRFASPMYLVILMSGISEFLLLAYLFLGLNASVWLAVSGLMYTSMILVGITAIAFPYSKRAKTIWESSPFRKWSIGRIPLVTIGGLVYAVSMGFIWTFYMVLPKYRSITQGGLILYVVVWAVGAAWYFAWRALSARRGVDVAVLTSNQLPPE